jgi:hypothetical protein
VGRIYKRTSVTFNFGPDPIRVTLALGYNYCRRELRMKILALALGLLIAGGIRFLASYLNTAAGGFFESISGFVSLVAFLVLGATLAIVANSDSTFVSVVTMILVLPLTAALFLCVDWHEYRSWVDRIENTHPLGGHSGAVLQTDLMLTSETGSSGFWGYYKYTGSHTRENTESSSNAGPYTAPWRVWTLRSFYFAIALFSTLAALFAMATRGPKAVLELLPEEIAD